MIKAINILWVTDDDRLKVLEAARERSREIEFKKTQEKEAYLAKMERYKQSRSGKLGKSISGGLRNIQTFGTARGARNYYQSRGYLPPSSMSQASKGSNSSSKGYGKRGRPVGTKDPRYAAYGGVYGWRKAQALANRQARLQMMRQSTVSPQQEAYLRQLEARNQAVRQDPERRVFPDTNGGVNLRGIQSEIDNAAHIFD